MSRDAVAIVAMADNGVIGRGNGLPWHLPDDLKRFKALTMGHAMLMGRKTWDSIGRALPGRRSFVLSRNAGWQAPGAERVGSLDESLERAGAATLFVIGRVLFWRGYASGAPARALGFALTFYPQVVMLVVIAGVVLVG